MKGKRILSAVLSAALLLQLSPLAVFAEDTSLLPVTAQTALTEPAPEETAVPMAAPTPEPTAEPTATPRQRKRLRRTLRKRLPRSRRRNPRQPPTPRQPCRR